MKLIRVAAGVLNQTPLEWDGNRANIVAAIQQARQARVSVLCLPELCITGYGCEDAFHSGGVSEMALRVLQEIVPETRNMIVSVGLPVMYRGGLFNAACLIANEQIVGFVAKQNLASGGLHYEPRWFKAWPNNAVGELTIDGHDYSLGDLLIDCGGIRIGFEICEDAWVAERPGAELAQMGVDIVLNPSASHFAFGKHNTRKQLVLDGSRAFHTNYVYANLLGNEAGRAIYDGDAMIASNGDLLATGKRFSFQNVLLTTAVVDVDQTRTKRTRSGSFSVDVDDNVSQRIECPFDFPQVSDPINKLEAATWEDSKWIKEEEFSRAISLGLFDYLRKSQSHGYVVSLSGGADSAAVATLAALSIELAKADIGAQQVIEKLAYLKNLTLDNQADWIASVLTCAYQSTRNSSKTTRNAARDVAAGLTANHVEFDVDEIVESYVDKVSHAIDRRLTWKDDDLALQNIQARARGPSVWLLANIGSALLLATSNRSEAAVGYATMDGDTCGGLSPIAGIDKAFLREWLAWMETRGPHGLKPLAALRSVNVQQPTAELRPQESGQTDEGDLMPYVVLDVIERYAIRDKQTPLEIFQRIRHDFPEHDTAALVTWMDRFFTLWCRNQWKRERYAPSFHVDDENLDPKTWCRFPILSGGYRRELRELRESVENLKDN